MTAGKDRAIVVSALKHAAPYIRLFKGKVFVLKVGGAVFADAADTRALMEQVGHSLPGRHQDCPGTWRRSTVD